MAEGKRGRKPWVPTPEILKQIEGYAGRFLQEQQIARLVGIHPNQFASKKKDYPELQEAIETGRSKAVAHLGNKLFDQAITKNNVPTLLFLAKSVMGLKENDPQIQESITFNVISGSKTNTFEF